MTTETKTEALVQCACNIAMRSAAEYLRSRKLVADAGALAECLRSWVRIKLPEALADAREALACGMNQVAEATFAASMAQAGIEAAKEAAAIGAD